MDRIVLLLLNEILYIPVVLLLAQVISRFAQVIKVLRYSSNLPHGVPHYPK